MKYKSSHPLWKHYHNMMNRCYNNNVREFVNYGGRGITVCGEWAENPWAYYEYVESLPDFGVDGYTVDRIDNDGNYEPGNLRWTDRRTQNLNRRKNKNNTTGYTGVARFKKNRVSAEITVNYKNYKIGYFDTAAQANAARVDYLIENELHEYLT